MPMLEYRTLTLSGYFCLFCEFCPVLWRCFTPNLRTSISCGPWFAELLSPAYVHYMPSPLSTCPNLSHLYCMSLSNKRTLYLSAAGPCNDEPPVQPEEFESDGLISERMPLEAARSNTLLGLPVLVVNRARAHCSTY